MDCHAQRDYKIIEVGGQNDRWSSALRTKIGAFEAPEINYNQLLVAPRTPLERAYGDLQTSDCWGRGSLPLPKVRSGIHAPSARTDPHCHPQ